MPSSTYEIQQIYFIPPVVLNKCTTGVARNKKLFQCTAYRK